MTCDVIWCYATRNYFLFTNLHVQAHVQTLPHTAESLFPLWSHPLCHGGPPPDVLVALGDPGSQSPSPPAPRLRSSPLSWLVSWKTWLLWQFTEETLDENIPCLPCMFLSRKCVRYFLKRLNDTIYINLKVRLLHWHNPDSMDRF